MADGSDNRMGGGTARLIGGDDPFKPYTEMRSWLPKAFWLMLRVLTLMAALALAVTLVVAPEIGVTVFWKIVIPSLPIVLAVVPGLWRQICPMAFANQIPVQLGWSANRTLPIWLKESSYLYAILAFIVLVALKHVTLYNSPGPLLAMVLGALVLAFLGGLVYKGRSGWCGTFCPLGPLQKVYGHTPVVVVKNGYCPTCVGCQKNCYDFSPRSAFFQDLYDKDPWYAGHRRFFVGVLPGLIISFWLGRNPEEIGYVRYVQELLFWLLLSAGSFFVMTSVLRTSVYKVAAAYGVVAIFLYYWFAAPVVLESMRELFDVALPDALAYGVIGLVVLVAARNLFAGYRLERLYWAREAGEEPRLGVSGQAAGAPTGPSILEKASGKRIPLDPNRPILDLLESSGIRIDFGCRTGMCGADPIVVEAGEENLSPPSAIELETLRRMGLEGRARLACVCRARGSVTIDLAKDPMSLAAAGPVPRTVDLAAMAGVGRVVIIGNGVAGVTAADRIRRASPSCRIDLVTRENHHFYNRMAIGRAIYGRGGLDGLGLLPESWDKKNDVTVWLNTIARSIDRQSKEVVLGTGERLAYDKLILATGGRPAVPPAPGVDLGGCFVLREARDAFEIRAWSQAHACRHAVVVGGGVLGIEAADALRQLGLGVSIVHRSVHLMDRNLDAEGSLLLEHYLRGLGVDVLTRSQVASIDGEENVEGVTLADGRHVEAQIVLFCIGVRGETALAEAAGLQTGRGVIVDTAMRTSDPDIYAIGDVAEFGDGPSGLWTVATQHAQLAADDLLKRREGSHVPRTVMQLKMDGVDVVAYGEHELTRLGQELIVDDDEPGHARRLLLVENGRIIGAVFVGPPGTALGVADAILSERDITGVLGELRRGNWQALAGQSEIVESEDDAPQSTTRVEERRPALSGPLGWGIAMLVGAMVTAGAAVWVGMVPNEMRIERMMSAMEEAFTARGSKHGVGGAAGGQIDSTTVAPRPDRAKEPAQPAATVTEVADATPTQDVRAPEGAPTGATPVAIVEQSPRTEPASTPAPGRGVEVEAPQAEPIGPVADTAPAADGASALPAVPAIPAPVPTPAGGSTPPAAPSQTAATPATSTATEPGGEAAAPVTPTVPGAATTEPQPQPQPQPSEPEVPTGPLTGEDLRQAVSGRMISGGGFFGTRRFEMRLAAGGAVQGRFMHQDSFGSQLVDNGRWTLRNDQLCVTFSFTGGGRTACVAVEKSATGMRFLGSGQRPLDWRIEP